MLPRIKQLWKSIYDAVSKSCLIKKVMKFAEGGFFISFVIIMFVINKLFVKALSPDDQSLLQNFIEWYAIFYTLVLSLIVGQSWKRYNGINKEIDREADALVLLEQTSWMIEKSIDLRKALSVAIKRYVVCIRLLKFEDYRTNIKSYERLMAIRNIVMLLIQSDIDNCLKTELLHQYYEVYDARGDRFDLIEQTLPKYTWFVFILASLIWLWGFLWLEFNSPYFEYYILGSVIATVSFLFYMARDLNNPIKGSLTIDFNSFNVIIFKFKKI